MDDLDDLFNRLKIMLKAPAPSEKVIAEIVITIVEKFVKDIRRIANNIEK